MPETPNDDPTAEPSRDPGEGVADPVGPDPTNPVSATSSDGPPDSRRPRGQRVALSVTALAAAAALGVGAARLTSGDDGNDGVDAAEAGGPGEGPGGGEMLGPGTRGTITEVGDDTLTLENDDGEPVTVEVGDDTVLSDTVEGSPDDIAEGDTIQVVGEGDDAEGNDDDAVDAAQIVVTDDESLLGSGAPGGARGGPGGGPAVSRAEPPDGAEPPADGDVAEGAELSDGEQPGERPGGGAGPGRQSIASLVSGTVESVDGDTVTVTTDDGDTVAVTLDDDTEVSVVSEIAWDDLAVDDEILVIGEDDGDTVAAERISRGDDTFGPAGPPGGARPDDVGSDEAGSDDSSAES